MKEAWTQKNAVCIAETSVSNRGRRMVQRRMVQQGSGDWQGRSRAARHVALRYLSRLVGPPSCRGRSPRVRVPPVPPIERVLPSRRARLFDGTLIGQSFVLDHQGGFFTALGCEVGVFVSFPPCIQDRFKIDKSFVDHMGSGSDESTLAVAVIELSRNLHLKAIAEGIETAEQAQRLRDLECDLGQGYLFAKRLTPEELARRLTGSLSRPSGETS